MSLLSEVGAAAADGASVREHPIAEWLSGLRRQSASVDAALVEADPVRNTNNTDRKNDGHKDIAG